MAPKRAHGHLDSFSKFLESPQKYSLEYETASKLNMNDFTRCCVPSGDCLRANTFSSTLNSDNTLIPLNDLHGTTRVICSNEHCHSGNYMHRECFELWEQSLISYLKTCGRARSWSERQRHQNLWTKKGYDLVYKLCACKCNHGYIRKDLNWSLSFPVRVSIVPDLENASEKKKKKKKKVKMEGGEKRKDFTGIDNRNRAFSSSSDETSNSLGSDASNASLSPSNSNAIKKKSKLDLSESSRISCSGANGIFTRRQDFRTFNFMPRHILNPYHIKLEDEGNHGNDETRWFILSTLAGLNRNRVYCVLCKEEMIVFDKYPLVDGTMFLSPRQYDKMCPEVKQDGRVLYLSSVCMACLESTEPSRSVHCRFCAFKWDGSSLIIGTMYAYDIFAASPCCQERMSCNNCFSPLLSPIQRLNFYSDYSRLVPCPYCRVVDCHFVKPLPYVFMHDPQTEPRLA